MIPIRDNVRSRTFPLINILLILLNVAVFVHEITQPSALALTAFLHIHGVTPVEFWARPGAEWPTLITGMFIHGGYMHLIGNLMYLWIFGDNVEDRVGHGRYFFFYLLTGLAAALCQASFFPESPVPMIGASGAIAGVMGAYFVLYPRAKVLALVPIWIFLRAVELPAVFFLGFWFLIQAFQSWGSIVQVPLQGQAGGGVAWWAHAGGFVAGVLLIFPFRRPVRRA